jgi:acylphosphatase
MDHNKVAERIIVSGKVQGVAFRAYAREQAEVVGIVGYVQNLPDGTVEIWAEGEQDAVDEMKEWCKHGPVLADVFEVNSQPVPLEGFISFDIRR